MGGSVPFSTQCDFSHANRFHVTYVTMENVCVCERNIREKAFSGATYK